MKHLLAPLCLLAVSLSLHSLVQAQVIPDAGNTTVTTTNQTLTITGGTQAGNNLFHSFNSFNLPNGQTANFVGSPELANILARITGGQTSLIDGLLQVTNSNAHLYLLNPAGVIFGSGARLDVPGSLTVTTAQGVNFSGGVFNGSTSDLRALTGNPTGLVFTGREGGAIINAGNLNVGGDLNLVAGTVISTGSLAGRNVTLASTRTSIPFTSGGLLNLEIPNTARVALTDLPTLLTGGDLASATGLTVNRDGSVQLTRSGLGVQAGDVVVQGNVTATQNLNLLASRNVTLAEGAFSGAGDIRVQAGGTVTVRDSAATPFSAQAGGNLTVQGQRGVDILALQHPGAALSSGGDLRLISDGIISGDAHFTSGGLFAVLNTRGAAGDLVSLYDPIISANTDVTFGSYTGTSLKIETRGNINGGNITITGPDTTLTGSDPDAATLRGGPAVILQAGKTTLDNPPNVPTGGFTGGEGTGTGTITVGNITVGSSSSGVTTSLASTTGNGLLVRISAPGDITTGSIDSSTTGGIGGAITLTSTNGAIRTGALTSTGNLGGGAITATAFGNIQATSINTGNRSAVTSQLLTAGTINLSTTNGEIILPGLGAVITSGAVQLGIDRFGQLNIFTGVNNNAGGDVGLTLIGLGDGTSPGCLCEGFGVAGNGISGGASNSNANPGNLRLVGWSSTPTTVTTTSVLRTLPTLRISQSYFPAPEAPNNLFQNVVTISNTGSTTLTDIRYNRTMDWDIPPTEFDEYVTIGGRERATNVIFSSDDGFGNVDPLATKGAINSATLNRDFVDNGPTDHGAAFDFGFGDLAAGADRVFSIYYGATTTEAAATAALGAVGAEVFSLGQSSSTTGGVPNQISGAPGTFIFAFRGVGGAPVFDNPNNPSGPVAPLDIGRTIQSTLVPGVAVLPNSDNSPILGTIDILRQNLSVSLTSGNIDQAVTIAETIRDQEYSEYSGEQVKPSADNAKDISNKLLTLSQQTGRRSAVIYAFAYPKQLELILITPGQKPVRRTVSEADRATLLKAVQDFGNEVKDPIKTSTTSYLPLAQKLHRWLIGPVEDLLKAQQIDTIAFSLDPGLRSVPMAALHDGERFLVQKYALGLVMSVNLVNSNYRNLKKDNVQVLAMGVSKSVQEQVALPAVPLEVATIRNSWQGDSFLDEQFTLDNLRAEREKTPFGVIHLATHGEFRTGARSNSFIQLWDTRLRLDQLRQLGWNDPPVDLLVLSACRTALGDEKAELGFAGLAIQAGVKSALASLWYISDAATLALMTEFYNQLTRTPTKSDALRQAQINMLQGKVRVEGGELRGTGEQRGGVALPLALRQQNNFTHPFYWAAFTMIGSPW